MIKFGLALCLWLGLVGSAWAIQYGQQAPDFTLTDTHGQPHTLSQYRGKVVFLQFFGWS